MYRQLNINENPTEARLKRKLAMREKNINFKRLRRSVKNEVQTHRNYHDMSSMTLNDIDGTDTGSLKKTIPYSKAYIEPSGNHAFRRRVVTGVNSLGVNLVNNSEVHEENHSTSDGVHLCANDNVVGVRPLNTEYFDIGDPLFACNDCGAYMWYQERTNKFRHSANPNFHICCGGGKIQLPLLKNPPKVLSQLLFDHNSSDSKNFQRHIRAYNMMFAFTSPGAKLDRSFNNGAGPPTFRINGQSCHQIGSLLPPPGYMPKFAQLYIYDTENEIQNRLAGFRSQDHLHPQVVIKLKSMLDEFNVFAKSFRMAKERYEATPIHDLRLKLIFDRATDGRRDNLPTVSNVAALIVGDTDTSSNRDIILEAQSGQLKRIDERHPGYLGLQYPLLFPYGEDGYRNDVKHKDGSGSANAKRNRVTIKEFLCFRLQSRKDEAQTLIRSRSLFQQFVVDGYTMMESQDCFTLGLIKSS